MAGRFSVEAVFRGVDQITAPLTRMQNSVGKFQRHATASVRSFNDQLDKTNSKIKQTAIAIVGLTTAAGYAGKRLVDVGAEFESEIVKAATRLDVPALRGSEAFGQLEKTAIEVGKTTEFSAIQAAQGFNILAGAGYNAEQAILALPKLMDMATVAGEGLQETSSMVNDLMSSFEIPKSMEGFSRATDVLAKTANQSNAVLSDLFETMKQAGPLSLRAKISFETISAMAGIMADAGIKGSMAGTSIKNFLLNLSAPSKKASGLIKRLGMNFKDAKGNLKDIPSLLDEINNKIFKLSSTRQSEAIEILFGKHGLAGMTALLNKGGQEFVKYREQLEKAKGTTKSLAEIIRDTLKQDMDNLGSAIEAVEIKTTQYASKSLRNVIQATTDWINKNDEFIAQNMGKIISSIADNIDNITYALKLLGIAVGAWTTFVIGAKLLGFGLQAAAGACWLLNVAMAVLTSPITLTIAGFAAIAGSLYLMVFHTKDVIMWGVKLREFLVDLIGVFEEWTGLPIKAFFIGLWDDIKISIQWVGDLTGEFIGLIAKMNEWLGLTENIKPIELKAANSMPISKGAMNQFQGENPITPNIIKDIAPNIKPVFDFKKNKYESPYQNIPMQEERINKNTSKVIYGTDFTPIGRKQPADIIDFKPNIKPVEVVKPVEIGRKQPAPENDNQPPERQVISPQDRAARIINENNTNNTTTNKAEITIKDETGRAKVTKGELGSGLKLQSSGGF